MQWMRKVMARLGYVKLNDFGLEVSDRGALVPAKDVRPSPPAVFPEGTAERERPTVPLKAQPEPPITPPPETLPPQSALIGPPLMADPATFDPFSMPDWAPDSVILSSACVVRPVTSVVDRIDCTELENTIDDDIDDVLSSLSFCSPAPATPLP